MFVAAAGCSGEADQVTRAARFEKAEVIEDAPVAGRNGMVRFIDDNDGKLVGLKARQASCVTGERRNRSNDHLRVGSGPKSGLFDFRFQFRIDGLKFVPRLQQQFLPMCEHQQPLLHLKNFWEMGEHDGFPRPCG